MTATPPAAEDINFNLSLRHGSIQHQDTRLAVISKTLSGNQGQKFAVVLAANAANQQVNLTNYASRLDILVIKDRGGKGFKVGLSSTGTKFPVIAGGSITYEHDSTNVTTPPTLFFDAVSSTDTTDLEISIAGNTAT